MEQKKCQVCGRDFDSGTILLDRRLKERFEPHTLTGWGLCPEHQKLYDDGYIALVAVDESKSEKLPNGNITQEGAYRTGEVVYLKHETFDRIFSGVPNEKRYPLMFCDSEVIAKLLKIQEPC